MRRLLPTIVLVLAAGLALGADDTCQIQPGETLELGKRCTISSTFTNVGTGQTWERSIHINGATSRIVGVKLLSINCTDCDVVIADVTCTPASYVCTLPLASGDDVVYAEDAILARTIEGTAYTQYLSDADFEPLRVTPTYVSSAGEHRLYVRVLNNDPSSDDDVTVEVTVEE